MYRSRKRKPYKSRLKEAFYHLFSNITGFKSSAVTTSYAGFIRIIQILLIGYFALVILKMILFKENPPMENINSFALGVLTSATSFFGIALGTLTVAQAVTPIKEEEEAEVELSEEAEDISDLV